MRRCIVSPVGFLALLVLTVLASAARGDLIVNGSFETPLAPDGSYTQFLGGATGLTGWTVLGTDVALVDEDATSGLITFNANHGDQWLDLSGVSSNSPFNGVSQDVTTIIGQQYRLDFAVGSTVDGISFFAPAIVDVSIDGGPRTSYSNSSAPTTYIDWQLFSHYFIATNTTTAITFLNGSPAFNYNSALDGVSLNAVPEPASFTLVAGLAGGAWWKRRRSSH